MKSHASMNRIYRLVFNAALGIWVAVAEKARGKGKAGRAACALTAVLAIISPSGHAANAVDATLRGGTGTVTTLGTTTTINQTSQRMALDWTQLSTAAGEALKFNQPNAQAIALNRIIGSSPSSFLGSLTANGQVFILNPNGILFGAGSQINVAGIVASTLGMNPTDFMNGSNTFTKTTGTGSVVNQGSMTAAQGGYLALLAPEVRNEGVMTATLGTALLAAGNKVTLNLNNGSLLSYSVDQGAVNALAENKQLIKTDGGQVLLSAKALNALTTATVNNTGVIEAKTLQNIAGRIMLMGDMEHGTANVGGTLDASAATGNGGFIETSAAKVKVLDTARVTTLAASGQTGTWLIDPTDFTIAATGGDITGATLGGQLASNNITLATPSTGAGNGDMFVNDSVSWSSNNSLTLNAQRNISFAGGGSLNASGATSRVNLNAGQGGAGAVIGGAGVAVTANTLSIDAATGIGTAVNSLQTNVANLRLNNATSGGIYAHNAKDVTVAAYSVAGDVRISTANGADGGWPTGAAGGHLTVGTVAGMSGITATGTSNVTLQTGSGGAAGGADPTGNGGNITLSQTVSAGGNATLIAGNGGATDTVVIHGVNGSGGRIIVNAALIAGGAATLSAGSAGQVRPDGGTVISGSGGDVTLNARLQTGGSAQLLGGKGGDIHEDAIEGSAAGAGGSVVLTSQATLVSGAAATLIAGQGGDNATTNQILNGAGGHVNAAGAITTVGDLVLRAGNSGASVYASANPSSGGSVTMSAQAHSGGNLTLAAGHGGQRYSTAGGSAGGSVTLNAAATAVGNAVLLAGNGGTSLFAPRGGDGGSVALNAGLTAGGSVSLAGGAGGVSTGGGATGNAGNVALAAAINASAASTVQITALGGLSTLGGSVTAGTLSIDAAAGIGSAANSLQTNVNNLRLNNTTSGGVYAHNAKDVTVAAHSVAGDVRISTANGADGVTSVTAPTAGGSITVGTVAGLSGITATGSGNVTLATGSGGSAFDNAASGGAIVLTQNLTAGGDAVLAAGRSGTGALGSGQVVAGGGVIVGAALTAGGSATLSAGAGQGVSYYAFAASSGGSVRLNARLTTGGAAILVGGSGGSVVDPNGEDGASGQGGSGGSVAITALGAIHSGGAASLTAGHMGSSTRAGGGGSIVLGNAAGGISVAGSIQAAGNVDLRAGNGSFEVAPYGGVTGRGTDGGSVAVNATISSGGSVSLTGGAAGASEAGSAASAGNVSLASLVSAAATGDALRVSGQNFVNTAGANALSAANGRWIVWSASPLSNSFGGIQSGNTALWSTAFNPASPTVGSTGNRFVFGSANSGAAVVAANNISKTYGDAFSGSFGYTAVVAGGQDFGNAFTDARGAAVALSGAAPTFSSAGAVATATRTGGNAGGADYDITADLTGTSAAGYSLLAGKGTLTINKAALTVAANNDSRAFGGPAYSGGNGVMTSGLATGDTLAAVLTGAPSYSGTAQGATTPGSYVITPGGLTLASSNYTLGYVNGVLSIVPAAVTPAVTPAVSSVVVVPVAPPAPARKTEPLVAALGGAPLVSAYQAVLQGVAGVGGSAAGLSGGSGGLVGGFSGNGVSGNPGSAATRLLNDAAAE